MTADKLFSECFVLCDIIYVGCQYLSSCDQINKTEKFKKQTIVYRKTILHYIIMKWVEHQNIMSILLPGKIFHFIIFVVKSFKQYQKKQVDNIPNLASIQSVAFRWALPGAAKCLWPNFFF
jgi:hypothetical protein